VNHNIQINHRKVIQSGILLAPIGLILDIAYFVEANKNPVFTGAKVLRLPKIY
jgi:hypothetical protein